MAFFQINKNWPQVEDMLVRKNSTALRLWWHLAPLTNVLGVVIISQKTMMLLLGVKSRTTVHKAIKDLNSIHLIMIGKIGNQNVYILNPNYINQTHLQYSTKILANNGIIFPSNVVMSQDDGKAMYSRFRRYIKTYKTGKINLSNLNKSLKGKIHHGKANKNGEKIKHNNKYTKKHKNGYNNKISSAKTHNRYRQLSMLKKQSDIEAIKSNDKKELPRK